MTIAVVQGTRPEIIKNYPIVKALRRLNVAHEVLHTNQHTEYAMRDQVYADLGYAPTSSMVGPYRLGTVIDWLQAEYAAKKVVHVIVNGDTAASIAGSLAAMYMDIGVSHVEAGLRARDMYMLEERNRIMVDVIASLLFPYTEQNAAILKNSTDVRGQIFVEGNTTVDVLADFSSKLCQRPISKKYLFATLHRKELTDSRSRLCSVLDALSEVSRTRLPVVLALHPRTKDVVANLELQRHLDGLVVIPPVDPFASLRYQKHATAVITDSGCLQEEAYMLQVPCITVRENTERHETLAQGVNKLSGFDRQEIMKCVDWALTQTTSSFPDIYGCVGVGERIVKRILNYLALGDKRSPYRRPLGAAKRRVHTLGAIDAES